MLFIDFDFIFQGTSTIIVPMNQNQIVDDGQFRFVPFRFVWNMVLFQFFFVTSTLLYCRKLKLKQIHYRGAGAGV